jgi:hypothetical protein
MSMRPMLTQFLIVTLASVVTSCDGQPFHSGGGYGIPTLSMEMDDTPAAALATRGDPNSGDWTIDFGQVPFGTQANSVLILGNNGTAPLEVLSVDGPNDSEFSLALPVFTTVEQGGERFIPISFKPLSAEPKRATVAIHTDARFTPAITLVLSGTGVN